MNHPTLIHQRDKPASPSIFSKHHRHRHSLLKIDIQLQEKGADDRILYLNLIDDVFIVIN